jgi:DNA repair protein RadC
MLSDEELLAAVLGTGTRQVPVRAAASALLGRARGSLRTLRRTPPSGLADVPGVGWAKASRIVAALELGRRAESEAIPPRPRIRGPEDVATLMAPELADLTQEEFHVLVLNARHEVTCRRMLTRGILDASLIHPREVFRLAVQESAAALILAHNHPSGDPSPSPEDRVVTRQMAEAGRTLGIPVLDHVVLAGDAWVSLMAGGSAEGGEV